VGDAVGVSDGTAVVGENVGSPGNGVGNGMGDEVGNG
jgi:hypothetical protein